MNGSSKRSLWYLWALLFVVGAIGIGNRLLFGHSSAAYGSYVVWGLWVSAYIYFIGLSAGAFLLSSLIYVGGVKKLEHIGKVSLFVAIITLFMALLSIWIDLGRMDRFYSVFLRPNFSSMMAWMIWLYTAYFLVLIIEAWLAMRGDLANMADEPGLRGLLGRKLSFSPGPLSTTQCEEARQWLRVLGAFGVPLAIAFHGGVGALFGTISAHPYWHTPLVPVLFLTGALVSGGALMMFVIAAVWPERDSEYSETLAFLGKVVLGLLVFDLILEWAEFSIPMWYGVGHEYELMKRILFGDFWWVFWVVHILLGSAVPVYLLLSKKGPWATALAGLLIAAGFMAVRLNIVIPGQVEPNLRNLEQAFVDRRLTFAYVPSLFEWQVTMFVIAIGIALFYLGYKYLPLTAERRAS